MSLTARAYWRLVRAMPGLTVATLISVALGVAVVVGTHLITAEIVAANARAFPTGFAGVTHYLVRDGLDDDDYFDLRAAWRAGGGTGIAAMTPMLEGTRLTGDGRRFRLVGLDVVALGGLAGKKEGGLVGKQESGLAGNKEGRLAGNKERGPGKQERGLAGVRAGDGAWQRRGVIAHRGSGLEAGDVLTLGGRRLEVTGTFGRATADGASWLLADIGVVKQVLDAGVALSAIGLVRREQESWLDEIAAWFPGIDAAFAPSLGLEWLPDGYRVTRAADDRPGRTLAAAVAFNLGCLSLVSVLVAVFLIHQAAVVAMARRAAFDRLLDALGVAARKRRWLFMSEGLGAAMLGAVAGLALGWLLATKLASVVRGAGALAGLDAIVVTKGLATGALAAFAALLLVWRRRASSRLPRGMRAAFAILGGALLLRPFVDQDAGLLAALGAVLGALAIVVVTLRPVLEGTFRLAERARMSLPARLDLRWARASAAELAASLAALLLAVSVAMGMAVMVDSLRTAFDELLDARLAHTLYVRGDANIEPSRQAWIAALPGVVDVRRYGAFDARAGGVLVQVQHAPLDAAERSRYGAPAAPGVLINEPLANRLALEAGAMLTLTAGNASVTAPVAYVYNDYGAARGEVVMDDALASRLVGRLIGSRLGVDVAGEAIDAVTARIAARFGALEISSGAEIRRFAMEVFDQTFAMANVLTLLALLVAGAGLVNALRSQQQGRQRELFLLRTLGFSAGDLVRMVTIQSVALGVAVAIASLPVGIGIGWLLCTLVNVAAFGWSVPLTLSAQAVLVPAGLAVALAAGTGLAAGRGAARMPEGVYA